MKKNNVLTLMFGFLICLTFSACSELESIDEKDDNGNIVAEYTRNKETFAKEGVFKRYSPDGKIIEEANYVNDVLDGERKIYTEAGQLEILESYEMGQFNGVYNSYHPSGKIQQTGEYVANEMTGIWKGFYEDGTLKEEVLFANNEENGVFKEYHPNGKLAVESTFENGPFEMGMLKEYDKEGVLISKKKCDRGICKKIWSIEEGDIPFDEAEFKKLVSHMKSLESIE